jgi:hypothetical protein
MPKGTKKPTKAELSQQKTQMAAYDYGGDDPTGFEGQTAADKSIPLITVLQELSPAVKKKHEDYVEGAEEGMLFNTATQELYDGEEGLVFAPACTVHTFLEFVPRAKGGGFVGRHEANSEVVLKAKAESATFGKYFTAEGNELNETFEVYAVIQGNEEAGTAPVLCVIPFSSTKIKAYRKWNTRCGSTVPPGQHRAAPLYANLTVLKTFATKNSAGQDYYGVTLSAAVGGDKFKSLLPKTDPLFELARDFCVMVQSGEKVAAAPEDSGPPKGDAGPSDVGDGKGENAPF